MIVELKIPVVDADLIARQVVMPGEMAYNKIVEAFGEDVIADDHSLDRKKLGTIIFNDEDKRKTLNSIVHPAVRKEMLRQKDDYLKEHDSVVLDIPLLYESKLTHMVDQTLLVYVSADVQLKRLMERDQSSKDEALSRIQSQIPLSDKKQWADKVIDNNGTIEESKKQLIHSLSEWGIL
ncbi:dephospho-CoA kinase [Alkalihalobacillus berkeleyi]|uniref:Dephospho-CoA kinase n=2 Tax=Pseudalkalibacillus berkeleyi TaxID=1069813 RepID=A0ABS9H3G2_9BACL|nr:dephospho-CoA kinase [Pseudalkalibacillus berkeleyi]